MHSARFYLEGEFETFGAYCLSSRRFKTRRDRSHVDMLTGPVLAPHNLSLLLRPSCLIVSSPFHFFLSSSGSSFSSVFSGLLRYPVPWSCSLFLLLFTYCTNIRISIRFVPVLCLRCSFCPVLCRYLLLHARIHACCPCPCRRFRSLPSYLVTDLFLLTDKTLEPNPSHVQTCSLSRPLSIYLYLISYYAFMLPRRSELFAVESCRGTAGHGLPKLLQIDRAAKENLVSAPNFRVRGFANDVWR